MSNLSAFTAETITRVYVGAEGCRCGCLGTYAERGTSLFNKRLKSFLKQAESYDFTADKDDVGSNYANITKTNGRVITAYND